jgi:plasmid stabilization system protein ParE
MPRASRSAGTIASHPYGYQTSGYAFHPDAFAELDEIWAYIPQDNIDAADRVLADIHTVLSTLAASPHIGHRRPDDCCGRMRFRCGSCCGSLPRGPSRDRLGHEAKRSGETNYQVIKPPTSRPSDRRRSS